MDKMIGESAIDRMTLDYVINDGNLRPKHQDQCLDGDKPLTSNENEDAETTM